jgi:hypothetical protein
MNTARIEDLKNCTTLKRQFAFELFRRTHNGKGTHEAQYEAAQAILREYFPHSSKPALIAQLAIEWTNDKVVADTFLQLLNGAAEGEFLPTKAQAVNCLLSILEQIDEQVATLSPRSRQRRTMTTSRAQCVEAGKMLTRLLGLGFWGITMQNDSFVTDSNAATPGKQSAAATSPPAPKRGTARAKLSTVGECAAEMARLYRAAKAGSIDSQHASRLANMLSILSRMIEGDELERRLTALEEKGWH